MYTAPPQWRRIGANGALFAQSRGGNADGSGDSVQRVARYPGFRHSASLTAFTPVFARAVHSERIHDKPILRTTSEQAIGEAPMAAAISIAPDRSPSSSTLW